MEIFKSLKSYLLKRKLDQKPVTPEGICPNCWGHQEFEGDFLSDLDLAGINNKNLDQNKGWIVAYAEEHLSKIFLKNEKCEVCSVRH